MLTLTLIILALITMTISVLIPAILGVQTAVIGLSWLLLAVLVELRKLNKLMREDDGYRGR